jgi:glycosyltransferase involved in cell wall biosynthesis
MRIGIDARSLKKQRTGIGNYIHGLANLLPQVTPEHHYFFYSNREIDLGVSGKRVSEQIDRAFGWCPGSFWLRGRGGSLIRRDQLDVFWATYPILPAWVPSGVLKIVTVYDLVWLRFPETTANYALLVQKIWARKAIEKADLIVTISRSTAEDLVRELGVPETKIRCVYPGVFERYKRRDPHLAAAYMSRKYGVSPNYMAAVGTVEPRKNLKLLVEVVRILKSNGQLTCPLLVVGASGWKSSPLFRQIQAAGLTEDEIRFLGYLSDEDLPFFYSGAEVFLFPTLYEGFGLPPVEAMACGTPVIASNARCMPEVLGDAAILEPPDSAQRFADAILKLRADVNLRRAMQEAGVHKAEAYSCQASAKQLLGFIERQHQLNGRAMEPPKGARSSSAYNQKTR